MGALVGLDLSLIAAEVVANCVFGKLDGGGGFNAAHGHFVAGDDVSLDLDSPGRGGARYAFRQVNAALENAGLSGNHEAVESGMRLIAVRGVEALHAVVADR